MQAEGALSSSLEIFFFLGGGGGCIQLELTEIIEVTFKCGHVTTSFPGYSHEEYPGTGARFLGRVLKLF